VAAASAAVAVHPGAPAAPTSDAPHAAGGHASSLRLLAVGALGVVYGDIGTSPLYAIRECFAGPHAAQVSQANVLGVMSLVFWFLILVISVKYIAFIMRADNRGEGGMMSLMALVGREVAPNRRSRLLLMTFGLFGSALLYGEGVLTPAISVLSAVEGLGVATHAFDHFVVPITCAIIVGLFVVQRSGTQKVGAVFGPVMIVWFLTLALLGLRALLQAPEVLQAVNPLHAVTFLRENGFHGFRTLGSVVLVITGGEALYADMGHFGKLPIRLSWFAVVLPALLLNYFGQGALLLTDAALAPDLFYNMAPRWALYPLVALATAATVIASQALISASFSLTRNAVQLGYCPRVQIVHTSSREIGQIYVPAVNWALMFACLGLVVGFRSSSALASAYGLAVTAVMTITSVLFYAVARQRWGWGVWTAGALSGLFLALDLTNFAANTLKFFDGGWFPIALGAAVFTLMSTWKRGRELLSDRLRHTTLPWDMFMDDLKNRKALRVSGTAVFMSGNREGVPHALLHNLKHNKVLHERNILLTIIPEEVPKVTGRERLEIEDLGHGFVRFVARFGFMEDPHVPDLLDLAKKKGFDYRMSQTTFFLGRETLIATKRKGMAIWREKLFASMSLNARSATAFFGLPPNRVVELGAQIEL
jgi:KUP system potassium uptake protein